MAEWFKGYAGNTGQRAGRWALDKLLAGNNLGADGTLTNEGLGLAGTSASVVAGLFGGPLAGSGARRLANSAVDAYANDPQAIKREQFAPDASMNVSDANIGMPGMPSLNLGLSQYGPYASGYQLPNTGFASGAHGVDMGYATIPSFGGSLSAPRGGWVSGGGGAKGVFSTGGYQSEEQRQATMDATQQALYAAAAKTPNSRQFHNNAN